MASTLDNFKRAFGIFKPQSLRLDRDPLKDSIGSLVKFSDDELPTLIHRHAIEQKAKNARPVNLPDIIGYIQPEQERSVQLVHDAERAKALIPEIAQAEKILVSSILSPNDLQEADPIYEIENMPDLPESVVNEICEYLKDRFTNEYELGEKMEHWTKEALFRSGAAVILTLPEATLTKLMDSVRQSTTYRSGTESLKYYFSDQNYKDILNKTIYTKSEKAQEGYFSKGQLKLSKQSSSTEDIVAKFKDRYNNELRAGIESIILGDFDTTNPHYAKVYKDTCASLEAMTATIVTKIEEGDVIKISENPEVLRFGKAVRNYQKTKLGKDFDKLWLDSNKHLGIGKVTGIDQEQILDLTNYLTEDENKSLPFNIEIPSEAVIPVCIPGQKAEKIGYFVLVDSHGQPIRASQYLTSGGGCSVSSRIANAYASMYGQVPTPGGIKSPLMTYMGKAGMNLNPSEDAMNNVFNYILDNVLRRKLKDVGLNEITFDKYESIATCMFYRMLENKETSLVFVPDTLMTYIAFDYRDNGCGKSLLEDISFVLSLIATLLVTNMMAQMKNAIAKQEITVSFDEDETNQDQVIEQIRNTAILKNQLNFTYDPANIVTAVTDQAVSIKAVKHPNAPGFDIERTYTTDQMPQADTDLLEKLQSWLTNAFGIPHSVFNQLDDAEFSRSVATSNLFFSQLIRSYQKKLCKFTTEFVRLNLKYSPTMQEGLAKIINNHIDGKKNTNLTTPINDGGKDIKSQKLDINKTLSEVINRITVSLAAPNIAPNKAQYEIVQEFSSILDSIVNNLYPTEIVHNEDTEASNGLTILKGFLRSSITKELLQHMGLNTGLDLQELDDYLINNRETMMSIMRLARNVNQDMNMDRTAQLTEISDKANDNSTDEFSDMNDNNYGGLDMGSTDDTFSNDTTQDNLDTDNTEFNF